MKAVAKVKREQGVAVIETNPDSTANDEVMLRVRAASICGSDLGFYKFTAAFQKFAKVPVIMGHEFAGEIETTGKDVRGFAPGNRVVCESVIYCGSCRNCRSGATNLCTNFTLFGMHRSGGFAEKVTARANLLHKIPEGVSFAEAGIVEPLTVAINGMEQLRGSVLGKTVVVVGPGPIGLLSAEVLRLQGASEIVIAGLGVDRARLELARKMGFIPIDWEKDNAEQLVKELTGGYGADVVVETAAAASAVSSSVPLLAKGGQLLLIGVIPEDLTLAAADLTRRQISILGSYAARWIHFEQALSLLAHKKVRADVIITDRFKLDEAEQAFHAALSREGCKVQFVP